jgi:hypothetical protein
MHCMRIGFIFTSTFQAFRGYPLIYKTILLDYPNGTGSANTTKQARRTTERIASIDPRLLEVLLISMPLCVHMSNNKSMPRTRDII